MNSIIELYTYLHSVKKLADKIANLDMDEYKNDKDIQAASLTIYKELVSYLTKLDNHLLYVDELNSLVKEIYVADEIILNGYGYINSDLLYDFYKLTFPKLLKIVDKLVK